MCYSLYNAPTMLLAGNLEAEELTESVPALPGYRPKTSWVHYTTSCNTQSSAPDDGRNRQFLRFQVTGRQHRGCIIPQGVTHSLVLLGMGEIIARNMLS